MLSRRRFLLTSTASALAGCSRAKPIKPVEVAAPPARSEIRIAVIGVSNRGAENLKAVAGERIVALCDVDEAKATQARAQFPEVQFFSDYRTLFDKLGSQLDAAVISTPDHTHAHAALSAIARGLHVYCEKPLCHTVEEVRRVMVAAAAKKVVTQMGTQIHAMENYRRVVEIVQSGAIGAVSRVHAWCSRRPDPGRVIQPPQKLRFDRDLWLGPVPDEFFFADQLDWPHFQWRWWWPFGGGVLADMGCHYLDLAFWALALGSPQTVQATGTALPQADNTVPQTLRVDYTFAPTQSRDPVALSWYHGVPGPNLEGRVKFPGFDDGVLFEGAGGKKLLANYHHYRLLPDEFARDFRPPSATIPNSPGHHGEWLDAIRGEGQALCHFGYSGPLTETVLLGNVAYRAGTALTWDSTSGTTDNKTADALLAIQPRKGWDWPV